MNTKNMNAANFKKYLLLADDDKNIREIVREWISSNYSDFIILESSDGANALDRIKRQNIDMLITDMKMPHMSGLELINEIEKLPENKRPKHILAMSGDDDCIIDFKTSSLKIQILEKPIDQETFMFFFNEQIAPTR